MGLQPSVHLVCFLRGEGSSAGMDAGPCRFSASKTLPRWAVNGRKQANIGKHRENHMMQILEGLGSPHSRYFSFFASFFQVPDFITIISEESHIPSPCIPIHDNFDNNFTMAHHGRNFRVHPPMASRYFQNLQETHGFLKTQPKGVSWLYHLQIVS